ncbi:MAG: Uncharacterized UPF0721 integral membrane protein [Nitrospira sp.]|nr:MAG: Uncharacterized UPF0721 integral membrane protein [Nitrospira sp.]
MIDERAANQSNEAFRDDRSEKSRMIEQAVRSISAGVPIGLQLGATGTGGAILGVPMMVYIAGIPVQQATAMSLMIVAASSLLGAWEYGRRGLVKTKAAAAFSWTGMIGSWGGAFGHRLVRDEVLLLLFGFLLLLTRTLVMRQRTWSADTEREERCATRFPRTCWLKVGGMGLVVGHLQFGQVDWPLTGFVLLGSVAGMFLGVRLGAWLPPTAMSRITASITMTIGVSLIVVNPAKLLRLQG